MTKMCENCGYVGSFLPDNTEHRRATLEYPYSFLCGKLHPYVLDHNRPLSHGALAPGAKP